MCVLSNTYWMSCGLKLDYKKSVVYGNPLQGIGTFAFWKPRALLRGGDDEHLLLQEFLPMTNSRKTPPFLYTPFLNSFPHILHKNGAL